VGLLDPVSDNEDGQIVWVKVNMGEVVERQLTISQCRSMWCDRMGANPANQLAQFQKEEFMAAAKEYESDETRKTFPASFNCQPKLKKAIKSETAELGCAIVRLDFDPPQNVPGLIHQFDSIRGKSAATGVTRDR
jgi:hypothetical protein